MSKLDGNSSRFSEENSRPTPKQTESSTGGQQQPSPSTTRSPKSSPRQAHKKVVFSDPVAFRYLEEDPATTVLERRRKLQGYEIYVVEQWACSRIHPTFIIATYTGDPSHSIFVGVLSIPTDEHAWSIRMKTYFKAVSQYHAREKETPLGTLMVTNLGGFPSEFTVIAVPDGDVRKHREDFIVNENLKRMGCSGRAGLNLQPPLGATVAKYHHLYRTSENVPLYNSVIELVKLCQVALVIYDKLQPGYADGLLCDVTEKALGDWWSDIGSFFFNLEPIDGVLGPTTVAALLGLLQGAHNRLKATGASVGKDVFELSATKRAIGSFQRSQKLEMTRRLDRQTLDKLHRTTAKIASGEGWNPAKAVKSTVAELSGKGGEMVMGLVGARDKAGIAEVETLDIERYAQLAVGPGPKWLWQGKPAKSGAFDSLGTTSDGLNGKVFSTDDQGNFMWTSQRDSIIDHKMGPRVDTGYDQSSHGAEGKSGFGRLRDVVGLRSHHQTLNKDDPGNEHPGELETPGAGELAKENAQRRDLPTPGSRRAGQPINPPSDKPPFDVVLLDPFRTVSQGSLQSSRSTAMPNLNKMQTAPSAERRRTATLSIDKDTAVQAIRKQLLDEKYTEFSPGLQYSGPRSMCLRRSQSAIKLLELPADNPRANRNARHLSFSAIEESLLDFEDISADDRELTDVLSKPSIALKVQEANSILLQQKSRKILYLERGLAPFADASVAMVESLDEEAQQHLDELNNLYYQRLEEYQTLRATSTDLAGDERSTLTEGLRKVEVLGQKLDYEVSALESRVLEVEDGINEFERNVTDIEARVRELIHEDTGKSSWFYHMISFFCKGNWLAQR